MTPSEFLRQSDFNFDPTTGVEISLAQKAKLEVLETNCLATDKLVSAINSVNQTAELSDALHELFSLVEEYTSLISQGNTMRRSENFKINDAYRHLDQARRVKHNSLIELIKSLKKELGNFLPSYVSLRERGTVTTWAKEIFLCLAQIKKELN